MLARAALTRSRPHGRNSFHSSADKEVWQASLGSKREKHAQKRLPCNTDKHKVKEPETDRRKLWGSPGRQGVCYQNSVRCSPEPSLCLYLLLLNVTISPQFETKQTPEVFQQLLRTTRAKTKTFRAWHLPGQLAKCITCEKGCSERIILLMFTRRGVKSLRTQRIFHPGQPTRAGESTFLWTARKGNYAFYGR